MVTVIINNRTSTRDADMAIITKGLQSRDPNVVRQANIAKDRINSEDRRISSMREALVRAHRDGNKAEIADIHDYVENHNGYRN